MKICELLRESNFDSTLLWFKDNINQLKSSIDNFDAIVQHHGTDGANVHFGKIIRNINNVDWFISTIADSDPKYRTAFNKINELKDKLEEKIKNSGGISY
jgi:uncharacterized protein YdcH (DUF465 family)